MSDSKENVKGIKIECDGIDSNKTTIETMGGESLPFVSSLNVSISTNNIAECSMKFCPVSTVFAIKDYNCEVENIKKINTLLENIGYEITPLKKKKSVPPPPPDTNGIVTKREGE